MLQTVKGDGATLRWIKRVWEAIHVKCSHSYVMNEIRLGQQESLERMTNKSNIFALLEVQELGRNKSKNILRLFSAMFLLYTKYSADGEEVRWAYGTATINLIKSFALYKMQRENLKIEQVALALFQSTRDVANPKICSCFCRIFFSTKIVFRTNIVNVQPLLMLSCDCCHSAKKSQIFYRSRKMRKIH